MVQLAKGSRARAVIAGAAFGAAIFAVPLLAFDTLLPRGLLRVALLAVTFLGSPPYFLLVIYGSLPSDAPAIFASLLLNALLYAGVAGWLHHARHATWRWLPVAAVWGGWVLFLALL